MTRKRVIFLLLMILFLSLACMLPINIVSRQKMFEAAIASTVQARLAERQPTLFIETLPPVETITPIPVMSEKITTAEPCYQALMLSETTVDGSDFAGGESFSKSWVLRNTGSCTWTNNYKLLLDKGDQMSGPLSVNLGNRVAPGEDTQITINFQAPNDVGTYRGEWRLQADNGTKFARIWVEIDVVTPKNVSPAKKPTIAPVFAVTDFNFSSITQDPESGACPVDVTTTVSITTNGAGTVVFDVEFGWSASADITLEFLEAGTQTYDIVWPDEGSGWPEVKINLYQPQTDRYLTEFEVVCD